MAAPQRALPLAMSVSLLLLFWLMRVSSLNSFPPFIDESFHLNFAELVRAQGLFARAEEGRQFTVWLYVLAQAQTGGEPIFVARALTVLSVLLGVAAAIGATTPLAGGWSGALAGLLLIFSAFHLFFDRLALADPVSASAVLVGVYFGARLRVRAHWLDAALCGFALFIAVGAKVSALPYLGIPLAAALTLKPPGRPWLDQARWALISFLVGGGLSILLFSVMLARGVNPFFYLQSPSSVARGAYLDKLLLVPDTLLGYAGPIVGGLLLISFIVLLLRRQFYLPLILIAPLLVLSLSGRQDSRHIVVSVSVLLMSGAIAVEYISARYAPIVRRLALTAILIWAALVGLPFATALTTDPLALPLTANDRDEYITAEGGGFGLSETLDILKAEGAERVIGILANCFGLRYLAGEYMVDCPRMSPDGEDIPALEALLLASQQPGVYAVLEDLPYAPASSPGRLIAEIEGAPGRPLLRIYALDE